MRFPDYEDYDALGLARLIAERQITPREALDGAIERTEARNPELNAIIRPLYDYAKSRADALTPGAGPLAGVPYPIKDLGVQIVGIPTSAGTAVLKDVPARFTSTHVERLEAADLVIFGKTNTSEFGLSFTTEPRAFGPTRNPWSLRHSAGGSSGGAAAAVAGGMVPAAHASDGGGSIRVPASCCGLFGLKPTRGRTALGPVISEAWSGLATAHAVTRSVRDSAALLDAVAGSETGDPYFAPPPRRPYLQEVETPPGRLRIALQREASPDFPSAPVCRAAAEQAAKLCEALGHHVEEADPGIDSEAFGEAFLTVIGAHAAVDMDALAQALGRPLVAGEVETLVVALTEGARRRSAADYARARATIQAFGRRVGYFFEDYDVILSPTLAQPPAPIGTLQTNVEETDAALAQQAAYSPFTQLYNATGCPAMSVPLVWSPEGLPLGVMFAAPMGREDRLFRLAAQLEAAHPWWDKRPSLP